MADAGNFRHINNAIKFTATGTISMSVRACRRRSGWSSFAVTRPYFPYPVPNAPARRVA